MRCEAFGGDVLYWRWNIKFEDVIGRLQVDLLDCLLETGRSFFIPREPDFMNNRREKALN